MGLTMRTEKEIRDRLRGIEVVLGDGAEDTSDFTLTIMKRKSLFIKAQILEWVLNEGGEDETKRG